MNIIDGHKIANQIKDEIVKDILEINDQERDLQKAKAEAGHRPNLAIILIGPREDSRIYVGLKEKEAKKVGVDTHLYKCEEDITTKEVLEMVQYLNNDPKIDGVFVQLPLPSHLDTDQIVSAIDPSKDVDRFHPENIKKLQESADYSEDLILPPVFRVVSAVLEHINWDLPGKSACIMANADIFKENLAHFLQKKGFTPITTSIDDPEIVRKTSRADLLITAVGESNVVNKKMVKEGATVIDVGITRDEEGRIKGDVDSEDISSQASYLTPVPGGVGPMTVAATLENVLRLYKNKR